METKFISPCANGMIKFAGQIQKFAHPLKFGKDLSRWKNTVVINQETRTTNLILHNDDKMRWKRRMISEVFLETIYRHHVEERRKNVPQGRSCPSPLEYMDSLFRSHFSVHTHFLILVKKWFPMAPLRCGGARVRLGRARHRHETGFSSWSFFVPCHRTHWKPTVAICLPAPPGLGSARTARRRHQ